MRFDSETNNNPTGNRRIIPFISSSSLTIFLIIILLKNHFALVDSNINSWAASIQSPSIVEIAKIIHYSFAPTPTFVASLLATVYLFLKKYKNEALLLIGAMTANVTLVEVIRTVIYSPRPLNGLLTLQGSSFPSGHVTNTVVLFGLLTYFAWNRWRSSIPRILWSSLFVAIAIVVGLDRIYLNVHWFSDVLGGYSLGVFLLTFSILTFQWLAKDPINEELPTNDRKMNG